MQGGTDVSLPVLHQPYQRMPEPAGMPPLAWVHKLNRAAPSRRGKKATARWRLLGEDAWRSAVVEWRAGVQMAGLPDFSHLPLDRPFVVLNLGGGVQSSTLYRMAVMGLLDPMPDVAVFADTMWEPWWVYDHLLELQRWGGATVPIVRATAGDLRESLYTAKSSGKRFATIPAHVRNPDGSRGMQRRQCTKEYKIEVIVAAIRLMLGYLRGETVRHQVLQYLGLSADEVFRVKPSGYRWASTRWPLIEQGRDRPGCKLWLRERSFTVPRKSACKGCPYRNDAEWAEILEDPDGRADVVDFDHRLRDGQPFLNSPAFLHRSCVPLAEIDPARLLSSGDHNELDFDHFGEECEGMCGV